jgi:hypothetical protein
VSSASGTSDNDWRNWLVVHGNDQLAMEDVGGIGQSIELRSGGGKENMFSALSRAAKGKMEST